MNKDGKGVEKKIEGPKNFKNFFKYFGRKWNKLLSVNLVMLFIILPLLAVVFIYILGPTTSEPISALYPTAYSASFISASPAADLIYAVQSFQLTMPVYNSYVYYVIGAIALVYVLTFGWQNVGGTYLLRGLVRGDPVFIISDYFYAIKKNFWQGLTVGIIDCLFIIVLVFDFRFFYAEANSYLMDVMYVATIALIIVYLIMRFYIYLQLITFDLKTWKIFKNAFIFTALGIKRNVMAILGIIFMALLNLALVAIFLPLNIIIPLVLPLFYFLGYAGFITVYAAYPVIEKYMINGVPLQKGGKNADNDPR